MLLCGYEFAGSSQGGEGGTALYNGRGNLVGVMPIMCQDLMSTAFLAALLGAASR